MSTTNKFDELTDDQVRALAAYDHPNEPPPRSAKELDEEVLSILEKQLKEATDPAEVADIESTIRIVRRPQAEITNGEDLDVDELVGALAAGGAK